MSVLRHVIKTFYVNLFKGASYIQNLFSLIFSLEILGLGKIRLNYPEQRGRKREVAVWFGRGVNILHCLVRQYKAWGGGDGWSDRGKMDIDPVIRIFGSRYTR